MVMVNVNNHRPPRQYTRVISLSAHTTTRHFRSLCEMHNGYKRRHAGVYALVFSLHLPSCPIIYTTTYLGRGRYVCKRLYSEQETVELRHHSLNNFNSISKAQTFYTPNCIPFYTLSLYMLRSLLIYINLAQLIIKNQCRHLQVYNHFPRLPPIADLNENDCSNTQKCDRHSSSHECIQDAGKSVAFEMLRSSFITVMANQKTLRFFFYLK